MRFSTPNRTEIILSCSIRDSVQLFMSPDVHSAYETKPDRAADKAMAVVTTSSALSSRKESTLFWVRAAKHLLWLFAWLVTAFFAMIWIIMPVKNGEIFYDKIYHSFEHNKQWGGPGAYILLFTGPVVVLAVVACVSLELEKAFPSRRNARKGRSGWLRRVYDGLWTQPLVVRGPMGMMTAMEILGFAMVLFVTLWHFWKYTIDWFKVIDAGLSEPEDPHMTKKMQKFEYISVMLGWVALVPLALLFLPVSRGSPILKLIDIPFEHAVKYHVWLGHMTMLLVTAHGIAYGIFYGVMNEAYLIVKWQHNGIANLPGVIALVAGLLMWPTSLAWMRRRHFNLFFNVHQLYVVFFAFAAWHLGILLTGFFLGGAFLFFIDRFLRFLQSRKATSGVTARLYPTGIVELKLPVSPGASYTPLSFMFLNVRGVARLQWHPFSTSSTPLDTTNYMSILIKPLGDWTNTLLNSIDSNSAVKGRHCPLAPGQLFAEGPYGHDSNYFLKYEHLLLVAGGIGFTPFMAIISDILFRYGLGEVGLPKTIDLIWCVKRRAELSAYRDLVCDLSRIQTNSGKLSGSEVQLNVKVFLTGERAAAGPGEVSLLSAAMEVPLPSPEVAIELHDQSSGTNSTGRATLEFLSNRGGEHGRTTEDVNGGDASSMWRGVDRGGSGSNLVLLACVTCASALGLTLLLALFRVCVYHPNTDLDLETHEGKELAGWIDVLLFLVSLVVAVVGFGGAAVMGSSLASKRLQANSAGRHSSGNNRGRTADDGTELDSVVEKVGIEDATNNSDTMGDKCPIARHIDESILKHSTVAFGIRPNLMEVMDELSARHNDSGGAELGVMVCGPETLAVAVAEQCRSQNFKQMWSTKGSTTQFHYHSVSFDL